MSKYGMNLARVARLGRRQLIAFALLSAVVNGMVTALVGAWLAQTYAGYQNKRQSVQAIANLVYERRTRAGMVVWALRRNAEIDEVRYRKRAYDEAFVEWNKKIQLNVFMIRDIVGERGLTRVETQFQDMLVPALSATDRCLTEAYDARIKNTDPMPIINGCHMVHLHQFTLDCGATITNELDRLTRLSFLPGAGVSISDRAAAEARIDKGCAKPDILNPSPLPLPSAQPGAQPAPKPKEPEPKDMVAVPGSPTASTLVAPPGPALAPTPAPGMAIPDTMARDTVAPAPRTTEGR
jgi:hypothetical protein